MTSISDLSDESLLRFYEALREEIIADLRSD